MDITRHRSVYDPSIINSRNRPVVVVGAGALGSQVAQHLFKLGIINIRVVDDDVVEGHNLPNQLIYSYRDIGKFKAEALAMRLSSLLGNEPQHEVGPVVGRAGCENTSVDRLLTEASAIFVCTDSMSSRAKIADFAVKHGHPTSLLMEGRMGAYGGEVFAVNLGQPRDTAWYFEDCLYPDSEVVPETGSCGETLNIGPTAGITASMLVWLFMQQSLTSVQSNWSSTKRVSFSVNPWAMNAHSL